MQRDNRDMEAVMQAGPLANYVPYTQRTEGILGRLAEPKTLAIMQGSSFTGTGSGR